MEIVQLFEESPKWSELNYGVLLDFEPFQKVLGRNNDFERWELDFYGYYDKTSKKHCCVARTYLYCVPYECNEHLLGTDLS